MQETLLERRGKDFLKYFIYDLQIPRIKTLKWVWSPTVVSSLWDGWLVWRYTLAFSSVSFLSWHNCRIICCSCCSWCHVFFEYLVIIKSMLFEIENRITFSVVFLHLLLLCVHRFYLYWMVRTINAVLHKYFYILIIHFCHCNLCCSKENDKRGVL